MNERLLFELYLITYLKGQSVSNHQINSKYIKLPAAAE